MTKEVIKIANCSGYYGDKLSAAKEMVEGGPIDVLTGDYLAELTMTILFNQKMQRGEDKGYVGTFLKQVKDVAESCKNKNIKIYFVWYGKDFCELDLRANMYNTTFFECVSQRKCAARCRLPLKAIFENT